MEAQEPVVVYTTTDPTQADMIRNALHEEGIRCEVTGENQGAFSGVLSVDVMVRAIDADRARALIEDLEEQHRQGATGEEE